MKKLPLLLACVALAGCDYTVPLAEKPALKIDAALVGLWQRPKDHGQIERLLVLPLNEREYMISFPSDSKDAMFAKACLCRAGELTIVQLEWFGTAKGGLPEDRRVFQFADYSVAGDALTVRLLNTEVVNKELKSSGELAKAIADNRAKPDLFRDKMVFTKVKGN